MILHIISFIFLFHFLTYKSEFPIMNYFFINYYFNLFQVQFIFLISNFPLLTKSKQTPNFIIDFKHFNILYYFTILFLISKSNHLIIISTVYFKILKFN